MDEAVEEAPGYPRHWEADVLLRDGGTAHLRPITPADAEALQRFHVAQSPESVYLRFFSAMPRLSERDLRRFTRVDHVDRVALVATIGDDIVGIGRFDRLDEGDGGRATAEVAFNIADAHQGRGLGSVLLEHLAAAARERGVHRFVAEVLPQNRRMTSVFRDAGYEVTHAYDDGVVTLGFDIDPTERSLAVTSAREHRAEASSLEALLTPRSVAVVGASPRPGSVGGVLLQDLVRGGYTGRLHAVHPEAVEVDGVRASASLQDLPEPVDLVVVAVPAESVLEVVRDAARVSARGVVVVSSGFAETGPAGLERQRALVRLARANGMRVVGPNSFGLISTAPDLRLNASLAPDLPPEGALGLFSQSGALGVAVLSSAARRGLGVSSFVSAGNRADVSGNDLMQFWEEDPRTRVVGLYLESVGNPRKFSRVARRLARSKPVVVVKSGTTGGAPPGHAVRTSRAPAAALDAMLRQAGVIRVETIHQLFDTAQLLVAQPLPEGQRVAVVGNSAALGALAAGALESWGLEVPEPPLSVHPEADADECARAVEEVFARPGVDAVVACFAPPLGVVDTGVARALARTAAASDRTTVACFLGMHGVEEALSAPGADGRPRVVPAYPSPEDAVRALVSAVRYAQWRQRDPGPRVAPEGVDADAARAVVEDALAGLPADDDGRVALELGPAAAGRLLACYGIALQPSRVVVDVEEALAAADDVGYPLALRFADRELRRRRDLGGMRTDIASPAELRADWAALTSQPGVEGRPVLVQAMAPPGSAVTVSTMEDELFGPVVSFGLAGDASELLGDVAHRIPPLTTGDVADLVRGVRAAPRLFGYRGSPRLDVAALEDLLARVSVLADDLPELAEVVLSPVVVSPQGLSVLLARVRLERAARRRTDTGSRRVLR
ncbi:GNAT family N-acetyltransferase [uncultured Pseudokineococcus sp.]|uniref:bifunctional acetate--CoA ligase family protein/GNAT family N-acetyltransferase n=1 Tax=uncultured Pseudokineococcus sp. TaxID=1642928 RepID=UPI0026306629|nr:GNAT family N-acetyltransferase [uncultured Pseudokineococcus sp.]